MNTVAAHTFLYSVLTANSSKESLSWLDHKSAELKNNFTEKSFYLAFSLVTRYFGNEKIKISEDQLSAAAKIRNGFNPSGFTQAQLARITLVLLMPAEDENRYLKILTTLFSTGEVNELVALYSALPLLPHPELLKERAAEGVRSNMTVVFEAIALDNPYPAENLVDEAFNQLVLKAVFIERPLDRISGIDQRANPELARMLSDYAHERWAASRYVTPELWRPVGPFIDENLLKDIERLLEQGSELDRQAAALALRSSKFSKAAELIPAQLKTSMEKNEFDWKTVSEKWFSEKNQAR